MNQDDNVVGLHGPAHAEGDYKIREYPKPQSVLMIGAPAGGLEFNLTMPLPNRWHRYWHKVFFGFTWKKYQQ
jgi:hypothetical protein